ncbi:TetR/AcrR family transcriptional regulator [Curtobacterium pusillum]|uniref:TetR/AcrR family transcriptional regulator n=1 Tax=Curtobacterium pusillum TaxID=69373 RepID=UPI00119D16EE|nr:TetR/AcrR family transcriptional regulator [Curtobacterium pusillum]
MAGKKAFDADAAEEAAMLVFWERGYADASLDTLSAAMGVGRSSFYNAFGDKATLFQRALARYGTRYGDRYERALASRSTDLRAAMIAFFDVTLDRIADPAVPRGCLIAQSVIASPTLPSTAAAQADTLLGLQRRRIATALRAAGIEEPTADEIALQLAAVNQSLAVLSRTSLSAGQLGSVARAAVTGAMITLAQRDDADGSHRPRCTVSAAADAAGGAP